MAKLITPYEVALSFSQEAPDPNALLKSIQTVEELLFVDQLGIEFYADLQAALVDYSGNGDFVAGTSYAISTTVLYRSLYYTSIQATTGNQSPENLDYWQRSVKFSQTEYNNIWTSYLEPALSYRVMANATVYRQYRTGGLGVQVNTGDSSIPATPREMETLRNQLISDSDKFLRLLNTYIMEDGKRELAVFANYSPILNNNDALVERQRKNKRHGFFF